MAIVSKNENSSEKEQKENVGTGDAFGQFVMRNFTLVLSVAAILLVLGGSYGIYRYQSAQKRVEQLSTIYQFKQGTWKEFKDKKLDEKALEENWTSLVSKVGDNENMFPLAIEMADFLVEKGENDKAYTIINSLMPKYSKSSAPYYFLGHYLSTIYDDMGKKTEAISLLEELSKSKHKFFEAKIYFDLGRLYQAEGKAEKAKLNFQYVIDNFFDNPMAKMARIYLQKL